MQQEKTTPIQYMDIQGIYPITHPTASRYEINDSVEGESIERRVERIMNNEEPITDTAPTIYTERKDGVIPEYDIRTDRFELALDMTDKIQKAAIAKRKELQEARDKKNDPIPTDQDPNIPK